MNEWGLMKPVLTALALPPLPFLLLAGVGVWLAPSRRLLGRGLALLGLACIWLSACDGTAGWLQHWVLKPDAPLIGDKLEALKARRSGAAIVVLGAGRNPMAPEYGMAELSSHSADRLRYGVWLSKQTGIPLGFSGGLGWAQKGGEVEATEAEVAARVALDFYGAQLRWIENASADTHENAVKTIALMSQQGVREVVVVTHAFHMRRARAEFEAAARQAARAGASTPITITSAPMDYWGAGERTVLNWLPSASGTRNVLNALRECLGLLVQSIRQAG